MSKRKILFFYPHLSTFIRNDEIILSERFNVKGFSFGIKQKWLTPLAFLKQSFILLRYGWTSDFILCKFSAYHSFFPCLFARLIGKPSLIMAGGMDTVSFPSIRYGNFSRELLGTFTRWSYMLASRISPNHQTLIRSDYTYTKDCYPAQGILNFCPGLKTPFTVIHNGFEPDKWKRVSKKKENAFITVSGNLEYPFQVQLKGIDLILSAAPLFPSCTFTIIGITKKIINDSIKTIPKNVLLLPPVPNEKLIEYFSESEFYMQLSLAEGFPNALCEAMLCECIPIVSGVFSMPDIVSGSGFIVRERNTALLAKVIEEALGSDKKLLQEKARRRIQENYTLEKRKTALQDLITSMLSLNK